MTGDPGLDHARPKALVGGAGNDESSERHPSVSVHPKSRLADILAHSQTRGSQVCSGSSQCAGVMGRQVQVLRLGVAQAHSDVAGVWVQILDGRHRGRSHRC